MIAYEDFEKIDIRVGTVISAETFSEARKPSYKLKIYFGKEIGTKTSSAQITALYKKEELIGRQVLGVVNFPPKLIAGFKSEVLTLGVEDEKERVILIMPEREAKIGGRMY